MATAPQTYNLFSNSTYQEIVSEIKSVVGDEASLKTWTISFSYFLNRGPRDCMEKTWEKKIFSESNPRPTSYGDADIVEYMEKSLGGQPLEIRNTTLESIKKIKQNPNSIESRRSISIMRNSIKNRMDNLKFKTFQDFLDIFIQIVQRDPVEKRPYKIIVQLNYSTPDLPSDSRDYRYEKKLEKKCQQCKAWKTTAHKLLKCVRCKEVYYCNIDCQKADWSKHKITCKT